MSHQMRYLNAFQVYSCTVEHRLRAVVLLRKSKYCWKVQ